MTPHYFRWIVAFSLMLSLATSVLAQQQVSQRLIIGGEVLSIGMAQQEAMTKLEKCCYVSGGKDPRDPGLQAFFIMNKGHTDILGDVWFRASRIERLDRNGDFSNDVEAVSFVASLYRLLSQSVPIGESSVTLQIGTLEASNASAKVVTLVLNDGRSVEIQIVAPDDPKKPHAISLKEILEKR
jgi:hypothetical protein